MLESSTTRQAPFLAYYTRKDALEQLCKRIRARV